MIASRRLVYILVGLALFGFAVAVLEEGYGLWAIICGVVVGLAALDGLFLWRQAQPSVERVVPSSLAMGARTQVLLFISFDDDFARQLEIIDGMPQELGAPLEAIRATSAPGRVLKISYELRPWWRGRYRVEAAQLRWPGPLGLMVRQVKAGDEQSVRVVPNFRAVSRYALMAVADRMGHIGVRQLRRRGEGMEFDHLREYRQGDQMRQIDWKATARHRRLIARQYEDERDQQVVLLFDTGRRMRSRDGELSHFDHVLNAGLLLSYVALKQGDSVAVGTFGGSDRWVPMQRGPRAVEAIVDQTFDLQTTMEPSDFSEAARKLAHRQRRRALIVILTNLYDADEDELEQALALLSRRHLVLVASLREAALDGLVEQEPRSFDAALQVGAGHRFLEHRREIHRQLGRGGAILLDIKPEELSVGLVNRYLEVKRAGRL